jgi:hypothetical protein
MVRILSWTLLPVAGVIGFLNLPKPSPYRFLDGHGPFVTGITREIGGGGGGWNYSIYSWKQNYGDVRALVAKEMAALGYKRRVQSRKSTDPFSKYTEAWYRQGKFTVFLMAGQSNSLEEAVRQPPGDPEWVTVTIEDYAPDELATWIRLALPHKEY